MQATRRSRFLGAEPRPDRLECPSQVFADSGHRAKSTVGQPADRALARTFARGSPRASRVAGSIGVAVKGFVLPGASVEMDAAAVTLGDVNRHTMCSLTCPSRC